MYRLQRMNTNIVQACRGRTRKAKAQREFRLEGSVRNNKSYRTVDLPSVHRENHGASPLGPRFWAP